MWPFASFAELIHRTNSAALGRIQPSDQISADGSASASNTKPKPEPSLPQPLEQALLQRAIRVCNRGARAIAQYMQTHQSLCRGR